MSDAAPRQHVVDGIDAALLTPLVRAALRDDRVEVVEWTAEPFGHSLDDVYGLARSILRLRGTVQRAGANLPWTLVLKIVMPRRPPGDPSSPENVERELLVYRSGLLAGGCGLAAPRCLGVTERADGNRWLWLEEVRDDIGREWPADRYLLAARHLAQFNAVHGDGPATASYSWLSRSPLREAFRESAPIVESLMDRHGRDEPFVARAISPESAASLLALLPRIDGWLDELDQLPQALCHWDAHRANLFSRTTPGGAIETVAIDWAGAGWGPPGADLSKLLSQTVNFFGLDARALPALEADLFEHYLDGLREAGWRGERRDVRFSYAVAGSVRLIVRTAIALRLVADGRARDAFERTTGRSFAAIADGFGATLPYYLTLADEAGRLA